MKDSEQIGQKSAEKKRKWNSSIDALHLVFVIAPASFSFSSKVITCAILENIGKQSHEGNCIFFFRDLVE